MLKKLLIGSKKNNEVNFMSQNNVCVGARSPFVQTTPVPIEGLRAPASSDKNYPVGQAWVDKSVSPRVLYFHTGNGVWESGGNGLATTTTPGIVELATLAELQNGNAPGDQVPTSNDVATVIAGVVVGAVPPATTAQQGIVELATNAEAVSPWTSTIPNTALVPSNIPSMFASPPSIGSTTPGTGAFTNVTASGTLGVTGVTTLAAVGATNAAFSGTLGVTGTSTLAAVNATNITASGTLGVTGATTLSTVAATNGTFSGTLGVTGTSTLAAVNATNGTFSGTLGVSGASSFSSGTFSTTLGVTGAITGGAGATLTAGDLTLDAGDVIVTLGDIIASAGDIEATAGALIAGTTITAGTGVIATTGGVLASDGDIQATLGDIIADAGDIEATLGSVTAGTSLNAGTSITATLGDIQATDGNLVLGTAGNKLISTSVGTTAAAGDNSFGSVTLVGGTATVSTTAVTTNSLVMVWRQSIGATGAAPIGLISRGTIVNGTSFVINALDPSDATALIASDVSVCGYMIIN
jgi:hypothetical protein